MSRMIRPLQLGDCPRVARIHVAARPGDLLPDLGVSFLTTLYAALLRNPGVVAFVYEERGEVAGFVIGCLNASRTMRGVLQRAWLPLMLKTLVRCASRPHLVLRACETLLYPKRSHSSGPELQAIAVSPAAQGRGIGTQLVIALSHSFRAQGFAQYTVAVKAKNAQANRFYRHLDFHVIGHLRIYNEPWDVYEYVMGGEAPASAPPTPLTASR
jgi:ribosomal protein S18 acetylase RimI-like enzyme